MGTHSSSSSSGFRSHSIFFACVRSLPFLHSTFFTFFFFFFFTFVVVVSSSSSLSILSSYLGHTFGLERQNKTSTSLKEKFSDLKSFFSGSFLPQRLSLHEDSLSLSLSLSLFKVPLVLVLCSSLGNRTLFRLFQKQRLCRTLFFRPSPRFSFYCSRLLEFVKLRKKWILLTLPTSSRTLSSTGSRICRPRSRSSRARRCRLQLRLSGPYRPWASRPAWSSLSSRLLLLSGTPSPSPSRPRLPRRRVLVRGVPPRLRRPAERLLLRPWRSRRRASASAPRTRLPPLLPPPRRANLSTTLMGTSRPASTTSRRPRSSACSCSSLLNSLRRSARSASVPRTASRPPSPAKSVARSSRLTTTASRPSATRTSLSRLVSTPSRPKTRLSASASSTLLLPLSSTRTAPSSAITPSTDNLSDRSMIS